MAALALVVAWPAAAAAERFRFPLSDDCATTRCTVVSAYRDVGMGKDWSCSDHTYAGHKGTDFAIVGSFTAQDEGRTIVAAAAGTVDAVSDGAGDRCTTGDCPGGGGFGNYVRIRHADGEVTYYAHMRMGSIMVAEGQAVTCGQPIGLVGSSGHSTGPHCHFEPRASNATTTIEPFAGACGAAESHWATQGAFRELPWTLCAGQPAPTCAPAADLVCGETTGTLSGTGGAIADYACGRTVELTGPERVYRFVAGATERVQLALAGLGADLDLLVLADAGGGCAADGCIAVSENGNTMAESVAFDAERGRTYYVVVDGFRGASSSFSLSARCTQGPDAGPLPSLDAGAGGGPAPRDGGAGGGARDAGGAGRPLDASAQADGSRRGDASARTDGSRGAAAADAGAGGVVSGGCSAARSPAGVPAALLALLLGGARARRRR